MKQGKQILAAETYESCGDYTRAVDLFLSCQLPDRAMRMLERANEKEKLAELKKRLYPDGELEDSVDSVTYADAGVDIDSYNTLLDRVKPIIKSTFTKGVASDIGTFGGMFRTGPDPKGENLLISSVDSVGTKLKIAFLANIHSTVGIDIVSHCANDILVQGAQPLFFMDYIGVSKIEPLVLEDLLKGIADACKEIGCALLGGEIAELPGFYNTGEYDLVGFIVGSVKQNNLITGENIEPGDVCIGLASSGLHTNGYSLVRRLIFDHAQLSIHDSIPDVGRTVLEELLTPHKSYVPSVMALRKKVTVKGLAHITGGGITDNLPRILRQGIHAEIKKDTWPVLPIFTYLQKLGNVAEPEMFRTFNMGIGMIAIVSGKQAEKTIGLLENAGEKAYHIGEIKDKGDGVIYV
jgi:phosphoribosylformylglycinamidine cyclo-ligase